MTNTDLINKLRIGFARTRFKIATKRVRADIGYGSHFFHLDLTLKIGYRVIINGVNAVVLGRSKIIA